MYPFEKLEVYQIALRVNVEVYQLLKECHLLPAYLKNQLGRASLSVMLNIAEGSARTGARERLQFLKIARGSVFECAALLDFIDKIEGIPTTTVASMRLQFESISKMLYRLTNMHNSPTKIP
jgi:four helix bundle protein